jgi:hypothetical protein
MPRTPALVTIAMLVVAYVPETGLDHLHLHVEDGHEFVHDHVHVGHHEHDHDHHPAAPTDTHDDHGTSPHGRSAVVSYSQAAQVLPPSVDVAWVATAVEERAWLELDQGERSAKVHPPWSPRAPPA